MRARRARPRGIVRLRGLAVAAAAGAALATAACLAPDARGSGTHRQLGLPACGFLQRTGWPCPTCGITTSVAALMHARVVTAFRAHPFGAAGGLALMLLVLFGAGEAVTGRRMLHRLRPGAWWAWAVVIGLPTGWGLKILIGLAEGTLPMR